MSNLFTLENVKQITDKVAASISPPVTTRIDTAMDIIEPGFEPEELALALDHPRATCVTVKPCGSLVIELSGAVVPDEPFGELILKSHSKTRHDNQTGIKGVSPTASGKFRSDITIDGHQTNLGTFDTFQEAVEARMVAQWTRK